MPDRPDQLPHPHPTAQLLTDLTRQGLLGSFPGLDLATWKLPSQRQGLIGTALGKQHPAALFDQRRDHEQTPSLGGHHRGSLPWMLRAGYR
jgi:hypothetical protein